jgi:hypothetical protein
MLDDFFNFTANQISSLVYVGSAAANSGSSAGGESDSANQSGNKSDLLDDEEDFFDFISRQNISHTWIFISILHIRKVSERPLVKFDTGSQSKKGKAEPLVLVIF